MQADGLIPMAFGDSDGWPAMGTFDIINLRQNGYDFHVGLMAGAEKWTDPKVKAVFETWKDAPARSTRRAPPAGPGRTPRRRWSRRRPACTCSGCSCPSSSRRPARPTSPTSTSSPIRTSGPQYDAEKALDAPIDGFMISANSPTLAADLDAAKAFMEYLAQPATQVAWVSQDKGNIAAAKDADTSGYTALQKKAAELIGGAQRITQFLDRDTNPNFAGPNGMQAFLLDFLKNPEPGPGRLPREDPGASGTPCSPIAPGLARLSGPWPIARVEPVAPATADQSGVAGATAVSAVASRAPGATGRFRRRYSLLTGRDKLVLGLMVGIPLVLDLIFIWGPTIVSFFLSFTNWNGIGSPFDAKVIGIKNYENLFTAYPFFWPALQHNLIWLAWLMFIATPIGILFAVLLDRVGRGTRFYQTVFYLPVVLSLAVIGIIWKLQYAPEQGFINNVLGRTANNNLIDWLGDPSLNLWAALVATSWRHVGYIMVLYLAGLKAFDPTLREAAKVDGANERQTFFRVVFPVMMPINVVIVVITTIEALRAFDIAYIINRGKNGLELLSTLITNNAISESNRLGFGSAIAVVLLVISLGPIVAFLTRMMRDQGQR